MFDDPPKQLSGDLQLLLGELGEELVLLKHVTQHAHVEVLQWRRERKTVTTYHIHVAGTLLRKIPQDSFFKPNTIVSLYLSKLRPT